MTTMEPICAFGREGLSVGNTNHCSESRADHFERKDHLAPVCILRMEQVAGSHWVVLGCVYMCVCVCVCVCPIKPPGVVSIRSEPGFEPMNTRT